MAKPLRVEDLDVNLGGQPILRGLRLAMGADEVVGVVGANGAGKSTLLRVLAGRVSPDRGRVIVPGPRVVFVPQRPASFVRLTVEQAVRLLARSESGCPTSPRAELPPDARIGELSSSLRQELTVELGVRRPGDVLLIDEPTQGLEPQGKERLLSAIRASCAAAPRPTVIVDHDRDWLLRTATRVVELRGGRLEPFARRSSAPTPTTTFAPTAEPRPRLRVWGLTWGERPPLTFQLSKRLEVTGAPGSGKTRLLRILAGWPDAGRVEGIELDGRRLDRLSPRQRIRDGLALVPAGRPRFRSLTVQENLQIASEAAGLSSRFGSSLLEHLPLLHGRGRQRADTLSGGEAQVLAVGRALAARPQGLLLDEPAVGLAPDTRILLDAFLDTLLENGGLEIRATSEPSGRGVLALT